MLGKIIGELYRIAQQYPPHLVAQQIRDIPRIAFHINLSIEVCEKDIRDSSIIDIGGGIGMFSVGCAALGFKRVVLADDFRDPINLQTGNAPLAIHRAKNVEILSRDVIAQGLGNPGAFDVVTTFDSIEHWHHSPKRLFGEIRQTLVPGGCFILGAPNCVNVRKRLTVLFGTGKWSSMQDWYELEMFRGHVREPDVEDLRYIAKDMGLENIRIKGRNWLGYSSSRRVVRMATRIADRFLRIVPSFCSDIYLIGRKPTALIS